MPDAILIGVEGRVWTTARKLPGNLIPLLLASPFAAWGGWLLVRQGPLHLPGILFCVLALVVGWLAINAFGLWGNAALRARIARKVLSRAGRNASQGIFVGFARPTYRGALDAHEDLGFLFLDDESVQFLGEVHQVSLARREVLGVRYRPNVHSMLGLGRWVSIEARRSGQSMRLLIEPREEKTLLGNRRRSSALLARIEEWREEKRAPGATPGADA